MTVDAVEAAAPVVDTARPWPGLDAFTEALSPFFFGRDAEAEELFRRVRRDVVTLLFGQSGLGKTSLLQAGLFPRLRWAGFLPILIRLDYSAEALSPAAQVKAAIKRAIAAADLSEATPINAEESFWGYFHRAKRRLADYLGKEIVPVLVFDQFEEIFTQGLAGDDSRAASQSFLGELAELIENRPPEKLEQEIEANPDLVDDYLFDRQDYRIVLALREDFLAALESLRSRAPSLGRNRYRLRRMTGRQGLDAILNPAPGLVLPAVAQEIIRFIGSASPEDAFGVAGAAGAVEGFEVEPSLLSLVCRELNERRIARGLDQIGADLLAGSRDDIIEGFYERVLADRPGALRTFVEDRLLSDSGFRESITLDSARRALSDAGVPATALDQAVRRRLLRIEERLDVARVEIIHDVLTPVIRRSRDTRHLRQAEAAAAEREAALRREQQRVRRAYWLTAAMALLVVVTIGVAWWGWSSKLEAERQRNLAEEQQKFAEAQRAVAAAATDRAERSLTLATQTANGLIFDIAQKFKNVAGVPAATIKGLLDSARKLQDQLAAGGESSPGLRRSQAAAQMEMASSLLTVGDTTGALAAAQQAQAIFQDLVVSSPDSTDYQRELSISYIRIGDVLVAAGRREEALAAYQKLLAIADKLAAADPGNTQWQRDLSISHDRIGNVLVAAGKREEALAGYQKSLAIRDKLAAADPGNTEWQRSLFVSHYKIGNVLVAAGQRQEALAAYQKSLVLADELAAADPGNTELQRDLSASHIKIGDVLVAAGKREEALAAYQKALAIADKLATADPGNTGWQRDLSVSHDNIGDVLVAAGKREEALAAYQKSLAIADKLAAADPGNTQWQRDLSVSHNKIGDVLVAAGKREEALAAYQKALAIRDKLAAADPGNTEWQRDLSVSHNDIGDVLVAAGKREEALAAYQKALAIADKLAAADPGNTEWQRDLTISHNRIGDVLVAAGRREEALAAYQKYQAIVEKLAAADPGNTGLQRDLAVSHDRIGGVLVAAGKREEALAAYQKCLAIFEQLAAADPGNTEWQQRLGVSHNNIGDELVDAGRREEALAAYQKALAIADKLAAADPGNTEWQRDLSVSHHRIGSGFERRGNLPEALKSYREAFAVNKVLARKDLGNVQWQSDLSWVVERISAVALQLRDPDPMVESAVERVEICRLRYASVQSDGNKSALAEALGDVSYNLLFVNRFTDALAAAKEALSLDPSAAWIETNRAHALLFLGRFDEAEAVYLEHKDKPLSDTRNFAQAVKGDFVEFRKFGIDIPEMKRIEVLLPQ